MKHFCIPYFLGFMVCLFRKRIEVAGYRRHSNSNIPLSFHDMVTRKGILKLDTVSLPAAPFANYTLVFSFLAW